MQFANTARDTGEITHDDDDDDDDNNNNNNNGKRAEFKGDNI